MEKEFKLQRFITLRYADPICAIDLTDKFLVYGTMLGTAACYLINQKKIITLSETQDEHISGVEIQESKDNSKENKIYICIGDDRIFEFNSITENYNDIPKYEVISNYTNSNEHFQFCDKCYTMLKNHYLVRTFIEFQGNNENKDSNGIVDTKFIIKKLTNLSEPDITGEIKMSNYSVPFDFDGSNYIFIDFLDEKIIRRKFNIYDLNSRSTKLSFDIENNKEKIGHISLLKILTNDLMFLVRDYNICEIRDFNFGLKRAFNLKGNEILAFDVFYSDENNFETLKIIVLDLNGNVILYDYRNNKQEFLFNMNNLEVDQIIKDQKFFSMGYPYYIKVSKQYMAISSDYGCVLIHHSPF